MAKVLSICVIGYDLLFFNPPNNHVMKRSRSLPAIASSGEAGGYPIGPAMAYLPNIIQLFVYQLIIRRTSRNSETQYIVPHFFLTHKADSTIFLFRKSNDLSLESGGRYEDWTDLGEKEFCLNRDNERFSSIALMLTNKNSTKTVEEFEKRHDTDKIAQSREDKLISPDLKAKSGDGKTSIQGGGEKIENEKIENGTKHIYQEFKWQIFRQEYTQGN